MRWYIYQSSACNLISACIYSFVFAPLYSHSQLVDERGVGLVDEQGFDAPGVDALYDLQYDPEEKINLLRSPFVQRHLSALHKDITPGSVADVVPLNQATRLQAALVKWLKDSGSEYAAGVEKRKSNIGHINQAPVLAQPVPDATWHANQQQHTLLIPAGTFLDIDGDKLHYTALLDRHPLPSWLNLDHDSGTLKGTPPTKGTHLVRVLAADATGPAFVEFQLIVM